MEILLTIVYLCNLLLVCSETKQNTYIFISGMPQGGTSLLHEMMKITPHINTMFHMCDKLKKTKCLNWNYEGQWLLPPSKLVKNQFTPGSTCPCNITSLSNDVKELIRKELEIYWNSSHSTIFIEKSPQSMTKIKCLYDIFSSYGMVKFLIIIKHPVTLNNVLPRTYSWLTHKIMKNEGKIVRNTPKEIRENINTFITSISHNITSSRTQRCSLGIIPTLDTLYAQLQHELQTLHSQIRIIRFEYFNTPYILCSKIYAFIFGSIHSEYYHHAIIDVCDKYFQSTTAQSSSSSLSSTSLSSYSSYSSKMTLSKRLLIDTKLSMTNISTYSISQTDPHLHSASIYSHEKDTANYDIIYNNIHSIRELRLHIKESFTFEFDIVNKSMNRFMDFQTIMKLYPNPTTSSSATTTTTLIDSYSTGNNNTIISKIWEEIDTRLRVFGYSLYHYDYYMYHETVLDPWDIMKISS